MRTSLQSKIILMILTVIIISVSTLCVLVYNNSRKVVIDEIEQNSYNTLQNINDYFLKNFMSQMEYVVNSWADNKDIKNYTPQPNQPKMVTSIPPHFKPISDRWEGYVKGNPDVAWIYLGSQVDGSLFITPLDPTMPEDYDCRKRDWYIKTIQSEDQTIWTAPYVDAGLSGEVIVTVAKTVMNENNLIGVIGMDIKLTKFSSIIKNLEFGDNGYIMLLGPDGDIYAHPDNSKLTTSIKSEIWSKEVLAKDKGTAIYNYEGSQKIITFLTVPKTGWKLVGILPVDIDAAMQPIWSRALLIGSSSVFITFLLGLFLSRLITQPIENIMKMIHKVSDGDLNVHATVNSHDEFKVLAEKLNEMIDRVRSLLEERDIHVNELTHKNQEIIFQSDKIKTYSEEKEKLNTELSHLLDEISKNYLSTVRSLANAIEASDKYTRGHCDRVTHIALKLAEALNLDKNQMHCLEFASILHDIGKIGIPYSILNKEGALTIEEFRQIQEHPRIGYDILADVDFLEESRRVLLQHHERVDGKGYPQNLLGESIHPLAKVLCVADACDAMSSQRPYRKTPLSKEQLIEQLEKGKGSQFDEKIVDVLVGLLYKNQLSLY